MKTKEKILNAALEVLVEEGFNALTQTRVAEFAGVRQGLLTYHFPKRIDLLTAVVDESKKRMTESRFGPNTHPFTLAALKELMIHFAINKTFPRLMLALTVAADEDPSLAEWFVESDLDTRRKMRELIKHSGWQVEESVLHTLRSIVVGASLINLQQNTAESEERVKLVIDSAFKYLTDNLKPL
ncbi:TetR/AcrR family transcriptional regulator [Cellvibrio mixtus]|uniref:TetR/AcrR family transcriptional regulator n=1 Tax=Cellvibrio mixtus TaxID=39650 RepID=UPI000694CC15|nr:TetR/AcrR family transcriptional regulator [Cellvibrio mixtus]